MKYISIESEKMPGTRENTTPSTVNTAQSTRFTVSGVVFSIMHFIFFRLIDTHSSNLIDITKERLEQNFETTSHSRENGVKTQT